MTLLCVPITVDDVHTALADAERARDTGADLVEFRIDRLFSGSGDPDEERSVLRLVSASPLPCIVTCRTAADGEGGEYDGDDDARISLYERLGTAESPYHPPRYIDVELSTYARSANIRQKVNLAVDHPGQVRDVGSSLILSTHDFGGRPPDLTRRILRMRQEAAPAVLKVAFRARSLRDNLELFDILAEADRPSISLGMGEFGLLSRVLAPKFGGFLTFAALRESSATAPGQPTLHELLNVYRFRSIRPSTGVYGVVGWPVGHSLSPLIHNAGFTALDPDGRGFDGVYLPLPVPPEYEHFKATLTSLIHHDRLDFRGCSVTIPHKEHLVRLAREQAAVGEIGWSVDPVAEACGAANTLIIDHGTDGRAASARVLNTDAPAAVDCLAERIGDLAGRRIALLGAGGVARAIAAGLAGAGASVVVFNRDPERADRLVSDLESRFQGAIAARPAPPSASEAMDAYNAVVNCTPIGMTGGPAPDRSPLPEGWLSGAGGLVVFDTVYTPLRTPLLRDAQEAGLATIDGMSLFVRQAAAQFTAWTGAPAPTDLFDRLARGAVADRDRSSALADQDAEPEPPER